MTAGRNDLEELERLEKAATPGPWCRLIGSAMLRRGDDGNRPGEVIAEFERNQGLPAGQWSAPAMMKEAKADCNLVAAARNALPDLIRIARAVAALDPVNKDNDGYCTRYFCKLCWAEGDSDRIPHKLDCAWVIAHRLAGEP